jgi:lysophospholipase L1-like esterase
MNSPSSRRIAYLLTVCIVLALFAGSAGAQELTMVAFGDSITHGLGDSGVSSCSANSRGYPPRVRNRLQADGYDIKSVTSGVCGERTNAGLSRIDGVLQQHPGEILLLMEGTNDLSNRNISVETVRFNLNAMADKAGDHGFLTVLAAPIPRDERVTDVDNSRTAFLSSLLEQDAEAKGYPWVPSFEELIDIPDLYDQYYSDPFHPNGAGYQILSGVFYPAALEAVERVLAVGPCVADGETLCLGAGDRFQVTVTWTDFEGQTGVGHAVIRTDDTGLFWFFGETNLELMVKVLDGRTLNDHFWVFYGSLSSVGYRITVTDVETGHRKIYVNPIGDMASVGDTSAFYEPK